MSENANTPVVSQTRGGQIVDKVFLILSTIVAVVMCVFHLLAASPLLLLNNTELAVIHGMFIVLFFVMVRRLKAGYLQRASLPLI